MSVTSWNRIEPRTRSRRLTSLQARVFDPLWMLTRQWQLGELRASDTGSPVSVEVTGQVSRLTRYRPGQLAGTGGGIAYPTGVPLDSVVESELAAAATVRDAGAAAEEGAEFLRRLGPVLAARYQQAYATYYRLDDLLPAERTVSDAGTVRMLGVLAGRVPDGGLLYTAMDSALRPATGSPALPPEPDIDLSDVADVTTAATGWMTWWDERHAVPVGTGSAWQPDRLTYEFAVAAPDRAGGELVLSAPEYAGGRLDWHTFDVATGVSLGATADSAATPLTVSGLPTPITFPGMPMARWWEFEDATVDLGRLDVAPDDLGRLLLLEFALVYGNDFFQLPLELPVGSICRIDGMRVVNTFGQVLTISPASAADGGAPTQRWQMFTTSPGTAGDFLFLPPTLVTEQHGEPLEDVLLVRDEMANVAWAVEQRARGPAGLPVDRHEIEITAPPTAPTAPLAPDELRYLFVSSVRNHWLPLVPTSMSGPGGRAVRLVLGGTSPPLGELLRPVGITSLQVNEEELPREGLRLTRRFRRTQWTDGSVHVWVGRARRTGVGQASSGLRYDQVGTDSSE